MASSLLRTIKQALEMKKNPLPWEKAISAAICSGVPVLIGWLLGNLQYGLMAGIGGFTYLYVFHEPYAERAKKLFFVMIGMTLSVGLGTLLAPNPVGAALMLGVIGTVATFIFGALRIPGPAAIFFVLGFALATGMPEDPAQAPVRAGLVFLGGVFSWVVGMVGWFFSPHRPEKLAVKRVYDELAAYLESIGKEKLENEARQRIVVQLGDAEQILLAGYIPWWSAEEFKRLILLNHQANAILLYVLEHFSGRMVGLPIGVGQLLRSIAKGIDDRGKRGEVCGSKIEGDEEGLDGLLSMIEESHRILCHPIDQEVRLSRPPLWTVFLGAFDKNSISFLFSLRYGAVLTFAALIADSFHFHRSYWIPLSCAAVMLGSTIVTTFHRAIQRSIGTVIGILVASLVLSMQPEGLVIALVMMLLTFFTELFIVRNYALAATFFTPNALLIAETTTQMHDVSYFISARLVDIVIGSVIGLLGTFLIGRHSASSRLPHLIAKTLRSQAQFLFVLFVGGGGGNMSRGGTERVWETDERRKMQTNLANLKTVYTTALGEIPVDRTALQFLWPVIFSIEQLGYLLNAGQMNPGRPVLPDEDLAQLLLVFENMAKATEQGRSPVRKVVPAIPDFPKIRSEIVALQEALGLAGQGRGG